MTIKELTREQIIQLKCSLLDLINTEKGKGTSYEELAKADSLISDKEVFEYYDGVNFVPDDFS